MNIIWNVFDLPQLGNDGAPEIQPSNEQNLHSERSSKPPKRFQVDLTIKS